MLGWCFGALILGALFLNGIALTRLDAENTSRGVSAVEHGAQTFVEPSSRRAMETER